MSMHVYTFGNMNGKQCQVTTSTELSAELLAKYKKALGIACTHTVEAHGNDIARPVVVDSVVPPSREYDAASAHIEALEAELNEMKRDTSAIEAAVLRRVAVDYGNYISDGGTLEAPYWLFQEAGRIEKGPSDAG